MPVAALLRRVLELRDDLVAQEERFRAEIDALPEGRRASASNLVHYAAFRRHDVRGLQEELADLGLSSLGRAEGRVIETLNLVARALRALAVEPPGAADPEPPLTRGAAQEELRRRSEALLGPRPAARGTRILVTLPSEAADDPALIRGLLAGGMDCARINCSHDGPGAWGRMIAHVREAARELGRACPVLMDLGGPKLRTGELESGPGVVKWRPRRDPMGRVLAPAALWLRAVERPLPPPPGADAVVPVPDAWLRGLRAGDRVRFVDTRGAARSFRVRAVEADGCWAESRRTSYVVEGTRLLARATKDRPGPFYAEVGPLPPRPSSLLLRRGDRLVVTRDPAPGRPARVDPKGDVVEPARIPCTLPEALADVRAGEHVWFDDGRIGSVVREASAERIVVEVTQARPGGSTLRADKGINLPESALRIHALTAKDREDLAFAAKHADAVGYSFVRTADEVDELRGLLRGLGAEDKGIVLKIETRSAFENLPRLLLAALRHPRAGVMIARGDLAVECGFERMAELQEEILWMCEAAHLPVVWATQVLERLAKEGLPSRAEITDAAMGDRAEAVMLNKGPYVTEAVKTLDDILRRMQQHQQKKIPLLRPLRVAEGFLAAAP